MISAKTMLYERTKVECILKVTAFLDRKSTKVISIYPKDGARINGITVLGDELFVIKSWHPPKGVYVYNANKLTVTTTIFGMQVDTVRMIAIPESESHEALVGCSHYNCLYVCVPTKSTVYRVQIPSYVISKWSVGEGCTGLSVTRKSNILATFKDVGLIREYWTHGELVREIRLDPSIANPLHCVELSTEQFVICHIEVRYPDGGKTEIEQRVCIVDANGHIVNTYGRLQGSTDDLFSAPVHLAVDRHDNIMVADKYNWRIVLLSPSLTHLGDILIHHPNTAISLLSDPKTLHLDLLNRRLYIGEESGGRVFQLETGMDPSHAEYPQSFIEYNQGRSRMPSGIGRKKRSMWL